MLPSSTPSNLARRCTFCPLSTWKVLLCTISAMQWQCVSLLNKTCTFKQFLRACGNFFKSVGMTLPSRNKHNVEAVCHGWHNGRNNRFHLPANAVALNGVPVFFADGKPHFGLRCVACAVQQNEVFVRHTFGMFVDVVVLKVFFEPVSRLQVGCPLLCRQRMTTLVSSSCQNASSAGCLHSCSETVNFASLSFLGLVGSFHFRFSLFVAQFLRCDTFCLPVGVQNSAHFHDSIHHILANTINKVKCLRSKDTFSGQFSCRFCTKNATKSTVFGVA